MRAPAWLEKPSRLLCVHTIRFFVFHYDIAAFYRAVCGRLPSCIEKQWFAIADMAHKGDDAASHVFLRPKGILGIKKAQRPVSIRLCFLGFLLREQKTLGCPINRTFSSTTLVWASLVWMMKSETAAKRTAKPRVQKQVRRGLIPESCRGRAPHEWPACGFLRPGGETSAINAL